MIELSKIVFKNGSFGEVRGASSNQSSAIATANYPGVRLAIDEELRAVRVWWPESSTPLDYLVPFEALSQIHPKPVEKAAKK